MKLTIPCLLVLALLATCLSGCNTGPGEPKKYPISGEVTLDSQPLPDGMIYFKDIAAGTADSAEIKDGKFAGQAEAGQRRIEIFAYRTEVSTMGDVQTETKVNTLPARFNSESTLTEEVTAAGPNTFKFETTSK